MANSSSSAPQVKGWEKRLYELMHWVYTHVEAGDAESFHIELRSLIRTELHSNREEMLEQVEEILPLYEAGVCENKDERRGYNRAVKKVRDGYDLLLSKLQGEHE